MGGRSMEPADETILLDTKNAKINKFSDAKCGWENRAVFEGEGVE